MLNLTDEPAHEYIPAVEKKQQLPVRHWVCTQHYFIHTTHAHKKLWTKTDQVHPTVVQ